MFISFEGIDGSGKSTQAKRLADFLRREGHSVVEVREPGGTDLAEAIRSILLDTTREVVPRAELLLFSAARADLTDRVIGPALQRGDVVVADRFFDSTTAYQGAGRGVADPKWLEDFHMYVTAGLVPDITYLLAVQPEVAMRRTTERGASDRMEASGESFYTRVADSYRALARATERVVSIDGDREPDQIQVEIRHHLARALAKVNESKKSS